MWMAGDFGVVARTIAADATQVIPLDFDMPLSPAGAVQFFRTYFGPTKTAFARLDPAGQAAFEANTAFNPERHTLIPNEYLVVRATRL